MKPEINQIFLIKKDGVAPPFFFFFFFFFFVRRIKILDSAVVLRKFIICINANTSNVLETLHGRDYTYTEGEIVCPI